MLLKKIGECYIYLFIGYSWREWYKVRGSGVGNDALVVPYKGRITNGFDRF